MVVGLAFWAYRSATKKKKEASATMRRRRKSNSHLNHHLEPPTSPFDVTEDGRRNSFNPTHGMLELVDLEKSALVGSSGPTYVDCFAPVKTDAQVQDWVSNPKAPSQKKSLFKQHVSQDGELYFENEQTGETTWTLPEGAEVASTENIGLECMEQVALYDFEANEDGEMSFTEGDTLIVEERIDSDWTRGTNVRTGASGLYPALYAKDKA